jgi:hypothetical protein
MMDRLFHSIIYLVMPSVSLVPLESESAFLQHAKRADHGLFDINHVCSDRAVIVVNAAVDNSFGTRLRNAVSSRPEVAEAIKKGAALLLDCSTEGPAFHKPSWEITHSHFKEIGLTSSRIVYITNNHAFENAYLQWALNTEFGAISVLPHNFFFRAVVNGMRPRVLNTNERRNIIRSVYPFSESRPARYLCLNHRLKGHRLVVLGRLMRIGAFERGYVSVLGGDSDRVATKLDTALQAAHDAFPRFYKDLEVFREVIPHIPLSIPVDTSSNQVSSISLPLYSQTWFSLVNESEMSLGGVCRFTEKTIKPLLAAHPMLIAGNPGVLSLLKRYGFETFSERIDESYDNVANKEDRLDALLGEFERLLRLSESEISRLAADLWPIHDANLRHLEFNLSNVLREEDYAINKALLEALMPRS